MISYRVTAVFALTLGMLLMGSDSPAQVRKQQNFAPVQPQPLPGQPGLAGQPVLVGGGELPVVPKSAPMFLSVKVSALVDHPDLKPVLEQLKKAPEGTEGFVEMIGVAPHEIDRFTLFWPTATDWRWFGDPVLVVTTREAYNEVRLLKSLQAEPVFQRDWQRDGRGHGGMKAQPPSATKIADGPIGKDPLDFPKPPPPGVPPKFDPPPKLELNPPKFDPKLDPKLDPKPPSEADACTTSVIAELDDPLFYELRRGPFGLMFLVDDRTLVFLPEHFGQGLGHLTLLAQLMRKEKNGPLADAIAAAGGHTFAAGAHLTPLFRAFGDHLPQELAPYAALLTARTGVITGNLDKSAKFTLTLAFDDAAAARRAGPVLEEGLKTLAAKAAGLAAEIKDNRPPLERAVAPLLETFANGLKNATAKASGTSVVATAEIEVGPAAGKAVAGLLQSLASQKKFAERTNHLKQIGLALHNYESAHGKLPTNIFNAKGEAILSWRVQLLPYLEYDNLYKVMKLDEPWDGPTNKQFIEQMPKVFAVPGREAPKGKTFFQTFVSPDPRKPLPAGANPMVGRAWLTEGEKVGRSIVSIPDGTSNTIAVVEAQDAVIWSKPDDLPFGEKLPALGDARDDRFAVLMFDGSVRTLSTRIDAATLRALITLDGGEVVPNDLDGPRRGGSGGAVPREAPAHVLPPPIPPKEPIKERRREEK